MGTYEFVLDQKLDSLAHTRGNHVRGISKKDGALDGGAILGIFGVFVLVGENRLVAESPTQLHMVVRNYTISRRTNPRTSRKHW